MPRKIFPLIISRRQGWEEIASRDAEFRGRHFPGSPDSLFFKFLIPGIPEILSRHPMGDRIGKLLNESIRQDLRK